MSLKKQYYSITAASVENYLLLNGWVRDTSFKNKNVMVFKSCDSNQNIALPASEKFDDFFRVLEGILDTLSCLEHKTTDKIIKEILSYNYDKLEFRIISPFSEDGKLPLNYASNCIEGLKDLILYSACAEQNAQPVCSRATNNAKNYLENFKLGQTEVGSFIINIDTQVIDNNYEQIVMEDYLHQTLFEHKVVKRISTALSQINEVVNQKNTFSDLVESAYKTGITANMCEALLKLKPSNGDFKIDTKIRYATAITKKADSCEQIVIKSDHFWAIDEISKRYRDKVLYKDVQIRGVVVSLTNRDSERQIRISTQYDGKYRIIHMELADDDYKLACDAHKEEREVEITGELDMSSRSWILTKIQNFKVI